MKILQVTNFFKPSWEAGGVTRVVYEISKSLVNEGNEVTVYTTDGFKSRLKIIKNKVVDVDGINTYYFRNLFNYLSKNNITIPYYLPFIAVKEIKNFDIIHIHEHRTLLAVVVSYYAKKYNIPYIVQAHGSVLPFFQKQELKKVFDIIFGNSMLHDASKVIALTKTEAEQYKKMGVDGDKIEIVPNGIDLSKYRNLPDKGIFRKKYGIQHNEKMVLYLGRIHRIKGVDLLVEAFSELVNKMEGVKLVIAGPDDGFLPTLKAKIEELNIGDRIVFIGPLYGRDKLEAYIDADVYVLPSVYETFPVTVLEACACGVPVIITDRCGIADFIDGKVGYVVKYDKYILQDTIFKVFYDEKLIRKFGVMGRDMVKENFNWIDLVGRLELIYETIRVRDGTK